jgi:hypothetical protein
MAVIYGRLKASNTNQIIAALMFGASMPIIVLGALSIPTIVLHGNPFEGIDTPEGLKNISQLFLLFGGLGIILYWAIGREGRQVSHDK